MQNSLRGDHKRHSELAQQYSSWVPLGTHGDVPKNVQADGFGDITVRPSVLGILS